MAFKIDRLKKIWRKFKKEAQVQDQIEQMERSLRWAKARESIRANADYPVFEEWLETLMFDYFKIGRNVASKDPQNRVYWDGRMEEVDFILSQIEQSEEFVKQETENLEFLKKKKENQ